MGGWQPMERLDPTPAAIKRDAADAGPDTRRLGPQR